MIDATKQAKAIAGASTALELVAKGAYFLASHSGGKDSQAQYLAMLRLGIPAAQIIVIHADLGEVEHQDTKAHIRATIRDDHEIVYARALFKDGSPKDFFSAVRQRRATLDRTGREDKSAAPDSANRYCTSDLKTSPIWREAKRAIKARGRTGGIIVNVVGIRAQESGKRSKKVAQRPANQFTINTKNTGKGTLWECYDWYPIAHWSESDVWTEITNAGQKPYAGYGFDGKRATKNQRISCEFCIFGSPNDLQLAAKRRPDLARKLIALEADMRGPLHISRKPLIELINLEKLK